MSLPVQRARPPVLRKDYRPPAWRVDKVSLDLDLDMHKTRVRSRLSVRRNPAGAAGPLLLDGVGLTTHRVEVNGRAADYTESDDKKTLHIDNVPERAEIDIEVTVSPDGNTALEGLYRSGAMILSQCEAEGFRKITWFPDRPDVMARYRVRLEGDRRRFPVLLSNGNLVESGRLAEHRHFVVWDDPFPKPSYLFAVVAGDLGELTDSFTTVSGRKVALKFYSERENIGQLEHAVTSLKRAMAWDEQRFGLEYDLDVYHVVATHDFNMGAMENKSLNVFNARYVLADRDTATDDDHVDVERVIGHEYFHNWTGNRVTCRDWFQLTLKEGLTVFREQEFSADHNARAVRRIDDVAALMANQFPEDAGPMAHPVRPEQYVEINNFYTLTVYEKGAEVVRMYETLLGRDGFRRGLALYFSRHDGQAVTCDDFRRAMADANQVDLGQFGRWYKQAGTPVVKADTSWDSERSELVLSLRQQLPDHPSNRNLGPLVIPIIIGFLDAENRPLPVTLSGEPDPGPETRLLVFDEPETEYRFTGLPADALPSLLRNFSAPVRLELELEPAQLARLAAFDPDPFSRWFAVRRLAFLVLESAVEKRPEDHSGLLVNVFKTIVERADDDRALAAELLALPSVGELVHSLHKADIDAVVSARAALEISIANQLESLLLARCKQLAPQGEWMPTGADAARRRLHNRLLNMLAAGDSPGAKERVKTHYDRAGNMTDRLAALQMLVHHDLPGSGAALEDFEQRYANDSLVMDKWFAVQASRPHVAAADRVAQLMQHPAFRFDNPNRVRAVVGTLATNNPVAFHRADGAGYRLVGDALARLDDINPQIAARLATCFNHWRNRDDRRSALMRKALERLIEKPDLSTDLQEVIGAALGK